MGRSNFQNLRIYLLSENLSDQVWKMVLQWPPVARHTVGTQLVRAADSIGSNIAEGAGRGSYQDNRRFILIARGSLYEVQHWLRRAYRRDLLSSEQVRELKDIVDNLLPQLNSYLNSITQQSRSRRHSA